MSEAIGLGLAFISLAVSLVQGCQYVRTTFNDIKDASEDFQSLRTETELFESTIETFRQILVDLDMCVLARHASQIEQALKHSDEAVAGLRNLVSKTKGPLNKWDQIRVVFRKGRFAQHLTRVANSKGYILIAQASILL
jgi:hypothetical protein